MTFWLYAVCMYIHTHMDILHADGNILWHFGLCAVCIFIPKWIFFMRIVTFYGILVICSVCIHSHINIFSCRLRMVTFYDILVICSMCIHSHINIFMWMVTYYGILFICSMNIHSHMDIFHADGKKRSKLL